MRITGNGRLRWLVALTFATCVLIASYDAERAIAAHAGAGPAVPARPAGYEADDHFPGAAMLYATAVERRGRPPGETGTMALPPLPMPAGAAAAIVAAETGATAARPFAFGSASAVDRGRALQCLADAIYYEAGGEPDAGQRAVAQVVLNRVRHPAFPATVCGVVYQGAGARGCQFSFACDGATARMPSRAGWARAARIAAAALAGYVYAPAGLATHYHSFAVTPAWNRSLVMTDVEGAHFFHRWKGYWGTASAFQQRYGGRELAPLMSVAMASTTRVAPAPLPAAIRDAGTSDVIAPPEPADHLPPASTILPRWRDTGKPL